MVIVLWPFRLWSIHVGFIEPYPLSKKDTAFIELLPFSLNNRNFYIKLRFKLLKTFSVSQIKFYFFGASVIDEPWFTGSRDLDELCI